MTNDLDARNAPTQKAHRGRRVILLIILAILLPCMALMEYVACAYLIETVHAAESTSPCPGSPPAPPPTAVIHGNLRMWLIGALLVGLPWWMAAQRMRAQPVIATCLLLLGLGAAAPGPIAVVRYHDPEAWVHLDCYLHPPPTRSPSIRPTTRGTKGA